MPPTSHAADEIAHRLRLLTEHLSDAPRHQAAQAFARITAEDGVLGHLTSLLIAGCYFAREQAQLDQLPEDVAHAFRRAANDLDDIGIELDEHTGALQDLGSLPAKPPSPPSSTAALPEARRRR